MSTTTTVEILVGADPVEQTETIAVAGFLAGCGSTRTSYATDLRLFAAWCDERNRLSTCADPRSTTSPALNRPGFCGDSGGWVSSGRLNRLGDCVRAGGARPR